MNIERTKTSYDEEVKNKSFLYRAFVRFVNFLYSLIHKSYTGQAIVSDDVFYKNSGIKAALNKRRSFKVLNWLRVFFSKSRVAAFFKNLTISVMSMSVKVYAIYFTVYGIACALVHYALMFLDWNNFDIKNLIYSIVIVVLSVPFLTSSKSLSEICSSSAIVGRLIRKFLLIPDENIVTKKRIGTSAYMIIFAALGLITGPITYFVNPVSVPLVFLGFLLFLAVMSFPESGVMMTAVMLPFLQYAEPLRALFPVIIFVTCISYYFKVLAGKRVRKVTGKGVILAFFCAFILVSSCFSAGGIHTLLDGLYIVAIIIGGFYITYNLMSCEQKLYTCVRCLVVSFGVLVVMGIWDIAYGDGVANIIMDSAEFIGSLISEKIIYIADNASNFGIIACFVCPIMFCNALSKKSVSRFIFSFVCFAAAIAATMVYGTYESVLALVMGLLVYIIFHSKKSFITFVTIIIIAAIALMLVMSFVPSRVIDMVAEVASLLKPVNSPDSEIRNELTGGTWNMIMDGNLGGIGAGEYAFKTSFIPYSNAVTERAVSPSNLYLQIICWSGFGGLAVFAVFFALVFKNAVGYMIISTDKKIRRTVLALTCSLLSVLMLGSVMAVWSDIRMFCLFWMMTALLCGYTRLGRETEEKKLLEFSDSETDVDLNVLIQD